MEFLELNWFYIVILEGLGIGLIAFGIRLLNQSDEKNSANSDPWNQPLGQRFGFSFTLTGILIILGMLMVSLMKLAKQ